MKRLIKKADITMETQFLFDWVADNQRRSLSLVSDIIKNNPDCVYNGLGYRIYLIDKDEFRYEVLYYLKKNKQLDKDIVILQKDELDQIAYNYLDRSISRNKSFSKDLSGIEAYWDNAMTHNPYSDKYSWLTMSDISSGLDIDLLYQKYSKINPQEQWDVIEGFLSEKEVIANPDSFEIVGLWNQYQVQSNYTATLKTKDEILTIDIK